MSTYYYIVCDDHKERTPAASRTVGGCCNLADGDATLIPFIITHHGCNVRIINEHEDDSYSKDFGEWGKDNWHDKVKAAKRDGRW